MEQRGAQVAVFDVSGPAVHAAVYATVGAPRRDRLIPLRGEQFFSV